MKSGDLVSFVHVKKPGEDLAPSAVPLLKDPPDFAAASSRMTITSWFMDEHVGMVLDEIEVPYFNKLTEKWTWIVCPTGSGWVASSSLQAHQDVKGAP